MSEDLTENPLLTTKLPVHFDRVKAEQVEPGIHLLLEQMKKRVADLSAPEIPRTYENILLALDQATEPLDFAMAVVRHLESVATYPELRAAYNAVQGPVSQFYTSIPLDPALWNAVNEVNNTIDPQALAPVHRRFLNKTLTGFRRAGADLDPDGKKKLEEIDVALTKATTRFAQNVLDATNSYEYLIADETKLAGLPESAVIGARESAKSKGREGWRLTLQGPSYIAAMTYLDDRAIRRELWDASNHRATSGELDNRGLIAEILRLRREKANLLGYRDFADYVLEERMAHNGAEAAAFVDDLYAKTKPHFERENQSLAEFARMLGYPEIEPWDVSYLAEKQRRALYDFDEEELRPYFELDRVVAGMFSIFGRVLGINVTEQAGAPGWDPAVKYYRIEDAVSRALLGGFYTDWFPRENKRGALGWMRSSPAIRWLANPI